MREKVIKFNFIFIILFTACFLAGCAGAFFLGTVYSKSGNTGYSERDIEYSRQMGRTSELFESVDAELGNVQDGLDRIKVYLGQDAGDLRSLAQRLRIIAGGVAEMENALNNARSNINDFHGSNSSNFNIELR